MTYQVFCQSFTPGTWKWTSKDSAGVGMRLDSAFRAFAAAVNALPVNASTPLSVVRSHADATSNRWGFTWQLGHPVEPAHIWFTTESLTAQGTTQSSSSAQFGHALASTFTSSTANGGYGSHSSSLVNSSGLAYIDTTSSYTNVGAILLIAQDTAPGSEFFLWALKTYGGTESLHRDSSHAIYRSPGTSGWCSAAIFPSTATQSFGQTVLLGYTANRFGTLSSTLSSFIPASCQQLRSGIALSFFDTSLDAQGLLDTPPPQVELPAPLYLGATGTIGPTTHFGKVSFSGGVMLQLGQRSSSYDAWLWLPTGTNHNQASPWSSVLALNQWQECNELHFVEGSSGGDIQYLPVSADFVRHFPHMSAVGARMHPQQGPLLESASGGGSGGGDGGGEGGGGGSGSGRPSSGLLWPRRT